MYLFLSLIVEKYLFQIIDECDCVRFASYKLGVECTSSRRNVKGCSFQASPAPFLDQAMHESEEQRTHAGLQNSADFEHTRPGILRSKAARTASRSIDSSPPSHDSLNEPYFDQAPATRAVPHLYIYEQGSRKPRSLPWKTHAKAK